MRKSRDRAAAYGDWVELALTKTPFRNDEPPRDPLAAAGRRRPRKAIETTPATLPIVSARVSRIESALIHAMHGIVLA
jgi:hypothetical protein